MKISDMTITAETLGDICVIEASGKHWQALYETAGNAKRLIVRGKCNRRVVKVIMKKAHKLIKQEGVEQ